MNRKTLQPYQPRRVTEVCRAPGDVPVEQPTYSGKTMPAAEDLTAQLSGKALFLDEAHHVHSS